MTQTIVDLNADQKTVLLKSLKDLSSAADYIHELVTNDKLTSDFSKQMTFLLEDHFNGIAKILDYQSHLTQEHEQRYEQIRAANETIRELKQQLGSQKPIDGLKEQLKVLSNTVYEWWNLEGFNHISDYQFTSHGSFEVNFCFMLEHRRYLSNTPVTDARNRNEHFEYLKRQGFEFAENERDRSNQKDLIDNPSNRRLLIDMLKKRFPSLEVINFNNRASNETDNFLIGHVSAIIFDLADIPAQATEHK